MPKTLSGKMSAIILAVFVIQFIVFIISIISNNGFGAIVNFIKITPFTALLGLTFGVVGTIREIGKSKIMPVVTLMLSIVYAALTWFFLYGWSFGG